VALLLVGLSGVGVSPSTATAIVRTPAIVGGDSTAIQSIPWQVLLEREDPDGYFYICGDASRMAKDVDTALHQVVEKAGGKSPEEAAAYVAELKASKRYRKDVY
jgi:hypothetical protein